MNSQNPRNSKSLDRKILTLSLPAIASNITVPLLGICDTAVTGHLGSAVYLAAIAAGGTMINVVYWLCGFLRMGTTGLTATAFGAGGGDRVVVVLSRSLILSMIIGILVVALSVPLLSLLLKIISPEEDVAKLASDYFRICIWGCPALLATLSINGWFIGMQNTVFPMLISIIVNIVNIGCSVLAVFVLNFGFQGVAGGTLISNWFGLLLALGLVVRYFRNSGLTIRIGIRSIIKGGDFGKFFSVSTDLFFRSACIMSVSMAVTAYGATLGYEIMAINTVLMQFFIFFSYWMDGFAFSAEALCGKFAGSNDIKSLRSVIIRLLKWSGCIALLFSVMYYFAGSPIVDLLTDNSFVRKGASDMSMIICLLPIVSVAAFIYDGFFIGLTATRSMFWITFFATALFFIISETQNAERTGNGNLVLWTAFLSYLFVRGAGLAALLPWRLKKLKKINNE